MTNSSQFAWDFSSFSTERPTSQDLFGPGQTSMFLVTLTGRVNGQALSIKGLWMGLGQEGSVTEPPKIEHKIFY